MKSFNIKQIEDVLDAPYLIEQIEKGLVAYSERRTIASDTSFLRFESPPGDVHVKSGAILGEEYYVIKVASGFYNNPGLGVSSSNGLMLLYSQNTGELRAILFDEGRLTDIRTGLAGAVAAKYLAKPRIHKIGIVGTGIQAREQLKALQNVTSCREVLVWGRDPEKAELYAADSDLLPFKIKATHSIAEITENCDLIVTTTPSTKPLLFGHQLKPGTHITAIGADSKGKQELDASVFEVASVIVVDSLVQCSKYGNLAYAKNLGNKRIIELGDFIKSPSERKDQWITVADLTGLAVEDLQVAKAVFAKLSQIKLS